MIKNLLLPGLALATLALNACSTEPSDFRPEAKVSVDMVAPGTRSSDNFDQNTEATSNQAKGGAIAEPISSNVPFERHNERPTADQVKTANEGQAAKNANTLHDDTDTPPGKNRQHKK